MSRKKFEYPKSTPEEARRWLDRAQFALTSAATGLLDLERGQDPRLAKAMDRIGNAIRDVSQATDWLDAFVHADARTAKSAEIRQSSQAQLADATQPTPNLPTKTAIPKQ